MTNILSENSGQRQGGAPKARGRAVPAAKARGSEVKSATAHPENAMFAQTGEESFRPPFSKGGTDPTPWGVGRRPQSAKFLYRPKAPEKGEFSPQEKRGKNHKWGFSLFVFTPCRGKSINFYHTTPRFGRGHCPPTSGVFPFFAAMCRSQSSRAGSARSQSSG